MAWRLAKSLETLRDQVNVAFPTRSKVSDGSIGDTAHGARKSDHNPNEHDVVCAIDITHDLDKKGVDFDAWKFAETLRLNRDRRLGYVISNGRIFAGEGGTQPWGWRPYTGANKHAHHTHISAKQEPTLYDDPKPWNIGLPDKAAINPAPVVLPPPGITSSMRQNMARTIVDFEAKRDANGLAIHRPTDGSYEIAGINSLHHPKEVAALRALLAAGRHGEAEKDVQDFVLSNTKVATGWTTDAGPEFYLRDCVFNRGSTGGARILQRAVGVPDDGEVGQITRAAIGGLTPGVLLTRLRVAREAYERDVIGHRPDLWAGLSNRWDKALAAARKFQAEAQAGVPSLPSVATPVPKGVARETTGAVIAGGVGGGIVAATQKGASWGEIAAYAGLALVIAVAVGFIIRKIRKG